MKYHKFHLKMSTRTPITTTRVQRIAYQHILHEAPDTKSFTITSTEITGRSGPEEAVVHITAISDGE